MQLVNLLWICLLTVPQASQAFDGCSGKTFGYKAIDPVDPNAYYLCLKILGQFRNNCPEEFHFNEQEQLCVKDKSPPSNVKNEFNINQNIALNRPIIFNFFGKLWDNIPMPSIPWPTRAPSPAITTTSSLKDSTAAMTSSSLGSADDSSSTTEDPSTTSEDAETTESSTESSDSTSEVTEITENTTENSNSSPEDTTELVTEPTETSTPVPVIDITKECLILPDGSFLRDPESCNKYYVCSNNLAVFQSCPNGLYFDTTLNVCNYPQSVDCSRNLVPYIPSDLLLASLSNYASSSSISDAAFLTGESLESAQPNVNPTMFSANSDKSTIQIGSLNGNSQVSMGQEQMLQVKPVQVPPTSNSKPSESSLFAADSNILSSKDQSHLQMVSFAEKPNGNFQNSMIEAETVQVSPKLDTNPSEAVLFDSENFNSNDELILHLGSYAEKLKLKSLLPTVQNPMELSAQIPQVQAPQVQESSAGSIAPEVPSTAAASATSSMDASTTLRQDNSQQSAHQNPIIKGETVQVLHKVDSKPSQAVLLNSNNFNSNDDILLQLGSYAEKLKEKLQYSSGKNPIMATAQISQPSAETIQVPPKAPSAISILKATEYCSAMPNGAFLRDSRSCSKYFVCTNGRAISRICPKSLYFDIKTKICNLAHLVDCVENPEQGTLLDISSGDGSISIAPEVPSSAAADTSSMDSSTTLGQESSHDFIHQNPVIGAETVQAPAKDSQPSETLQIGANTNNFVAMDHSLPQIVSFAEKPQEANVENPMIEAVSQTVQVGPEESSAGSIVKATEYCIGMPNGAFLRDSKSCSKYYVCSNGRALSRLCPKSLYFDIKTKICNLAHLVDCVENLEQSSLLDISSEVSGGSSLAPAVTGQSDIASHLVTQNLINEAETEHVPPKSEPSETSESLLIDSNNINSTDQIVLQLGSYAEKLNESSQHLSEQNPIIGTAQIPEGQNTDNGAAQILQGEQSSETVQVPPVEHSAASILKATEYCSAMPNGALLRDSRSCSKYFVCTNGRALSRMCPKSLYFDIKTKICNLAHLVDCVENLEQSSLLDIAAAQIPQEEKSAKTDLITPEQPTAVSIMKATEYCSDMPNGAFLRDSRSCSKYYVCTTGRALSRQCPKNLYFEIKTKSCKLAKFVDCSESVDQSLSPNSLLENISENASVSLDSKSPSSASAVMESSEVQSLNNLTVSGDSEHSESSLLQFIFNYFHSEDAKMQQLESSVEEPAENSENSTGKIPMIETVDISSNALPESSMKNASEYCRIFLNGAYIRDLMSCNKYYVCANGQAIPRMCPNNLYFDIKKKICNFAHLVDCSQNLQQNSDSLPEYSTSNSGEIHNSGISTTSLVDSLTPESSFWDTLIEDSATESVPEILGSEKSASSLVDTQNVVSSDSRCSSRPNGFYLRDPMSCSKFYICANGRAISRSCPRNLYFDMQSKVCNLPSLVKCEFENGENQNSEELLSSSAHELNSNLKFKAETSSFFHKSDKNLPMHPTDSEKTADCTGLPNGSFLRYPNSCGQFYVCSYGNAILRNCPGVLYFDFKKMVCNFPSLVDCSIGQHAILVDRKTNNSKNHIIPRDLKKGENSTFVPDCTRAANGDYLSDSQSCNKFYVCANGHAIHRHCPKGLYIDIKKKYCNLPSQVECPLDKNALKSVQSPLAIVVDKPDCSAKSEGATLRDPKLCNKYYVCRKGNPIIHFCKPGLWFDLKRQVCDQKHLVECKI